jgi:hypothetical protein
MECGEQSRLAVDRGARGVSAAGGELRGRDAFAPRASAVTVWSAVAPSSFDPAAAAAIGPVTPVGRKIFVTSESITIRPILPPTS